MQSEEVEINFRSVAVNAGVSTAWLYRTKSLRDTIMKARVTFPQRHELLFAIELVAPAPKFRSAGID
jgi:hypothetical protein